MILTVTLNAALDVTYRVDELRPQQTHRVSSVVTRAGGKGVNVAAVLTQIREPVVATGLVGGPTGEQIRHRLAAARIADSFVPVAADSRRTLVVADRTGATGFWEPGPPVTAEEWSAFVARFRGLATVSRAVVLSGSLPAGVPADAYAELVTIARELAVPSIVDAEGTALAAALDARPDVVKPNAHELASVTGGTAPDTVTEVLAAAEALRTRGAGAVVASRGADGLVAATPDGAYRAAPPAAVTGNPTGAGDAAVAALARGLAYRTGWPATLTDAVALSAAAVAAPEAGQVDGREYDRLRKIITVETVTE
ncbi:1-phosphofructokinase family hexose kinase [Actinocatenispora rupis]|uniref:Sugar kinase n=1 Tax=Actinocatenispora rupis TaxID=519421 RepID=A0A8J3NFE8_9ACTN|nr:1-phosphofructokinase family hexose kinase [Actinocatenispora rupis]GID13709.1 sugar kinase [Actinocatenispora rupis]